MGSKRGNEYRPNVVYPPGDTLLETIEAMGMSQAELAARMGVTEKHVSSVVKGKSPISEDTALRLERVLGIDAAFWRNLEHLYRRHLAEQEERKRLGQKKAWPERFPLKEMIRRKWIDFYDDPVDQLTELLSFFGVATWDSWQDLWTKDAAYRTSPVFEINPSAMAAWLRRGELLAREIPSEPFDGKAFRRLLPELRALSQRSVEEYLGELPKRCASCGVVLVFLKELPETRVSGVARWLSKDRALIQLSDRYKTDDHFWFALFHEAAHILLHGKRDVFIEEDIGKGTGEKEDEANRKASEWLVPSEGPYEGLIAQRPIRLVDIEETAEAMGIAPGILVGRLQHDKALPFSHGNRLKRTIRFP